MAKETKEERVKLLNGRQGGGWLRSLLDAGGARVAYNQRIGCRVLACTGYVPGLVFAAATCSPLRGKGLAYPITPPEPRTSKESEK